MTEHSTPPRFDPIDGGPFRSDWRLWNEITRPVMNVADLSVPRRTRELIEDRTLAWQDRIAEDHRQHSEAVRRRREAAILRRLNRPHRRVLRWLRSWRG